MLRPKLASELKYLTFDKQANTKQKDDYDSYILRTFMSCYIMIDVKKAKNKFGGLFASRRPKP